MKVLITGVAGFIGSHLAERCLAEGWQVVGCDSFTDYYDPTLKRENLADLADAAAFDLVEGDITRTIDDELLADVDVVFHQAGQPGVRGSWESGFAAYLDRNIGATQALLERCRHAPRMPRVVMASSSSVYGNAQVYPVSESTETRPFSPYGVTKLAAERLGVAYAENFGLEVVALRYFTVYGPRQRPDMATHRLVSAALGRGEFRLFGDGQHIRDFTYVGDVVQANILAATTALDATPLVVNVCGGSSVSMIELIATIGEVAGCEVPVEKTGTQAGDVLRTGGSNDLARRELGWTPNTSLRSGLASHVEWMRGRQFRA